LLAGLKGLDPGFTPIIGAIMRTHFLTNLQIKGREEVLRIVPEFDFYKLRRIIRLQWDSHCNPENGTADADLILTIAYDAQSASTPQFTFRFGGVARAKLPELLPSVYLSEVEVEDLHGSQLENIRFRLKDYGQTELEIECKSVEMIAHDSKIQ
jgi:hypothetical protein